MVTALINHGSLASMRTNLGFACCLLLTFWKIGAVTSSAIAAAPDSTNSHSLQNNVLRRDAPLNYRNPPLPPGHPCNGTNECVNHTTCEHANGGTSGPMTCVCRDSHYADRLSGVCQRRTAQGEHCTAQEDTCMVGAMCHNNVCECVQQQLDFYDTSRNRCVPRGRHNQACNDSSPCVQDATCINNVCECEDRFFYVDNRSLCVARHAPDAACSDANQCVWNASCTNSSCVCHNDFHKFEQRCDKRIGLNSLCGHTFQCLENGECVNNKCQCDSHSYNDRNVTCRASVVFNGYCDYYNTDPRQCGNGTSCVFRATDDRPKCACDTDHFFADGLGCHARGMASEGCPFAVRRNDATEFDKQCVENAICNSTNICVCEPGHYFRSGRCPQRIANGGTCDPWSDYPLQCQDGLACVFGACKPAAG